MLIRQKIKTIILVFTFLLLGAHFFRTGEILLAIASVFIPSLLFIKKKWSITVVKLFAYGGVIVWIMTLINLINERVQNNEQWVRMALILAVVIFINIITIFILSSKDFKEKYK